MSDESRLILDTHSFLWFVEDSPRLSPRARRAIMDVDEVFLSRASAWEIAIKVSLGKLPLKAPLPTLLNELAKDAVVYLEITTSHILRAAALPHHHRDPFDRMIVAQAVEENLTVVGADAKFDAYGVPRLF